MQGFGHLLARIETADTMRVEGRVSAVVGQSVRASLPRARLGDAVEIRPRAGDALLASVVGFGTDEVVLAPFGSLTGLSVGDAVVSTGALPSVIVGESLVGRVLDGLGRPFDGGPPVTGARRPLAATPPHPLARARIAQPLVTGVRALDGLLTLGVGQRVGLFAGSGVGKSTLLGQIARGSSADVVVVNLVGERGREVREFLEDALSAEGRARSVVVCATSDESALVRKTSAYVATAIAEHFRDEGRSVLLLVDSVTRFARAAREVALAAGEPPARRGYPASVFAELPVLLERSGQGARGSITAIYTVLVEGSDMEEPIADEVRGILDGHVVLDRALATRGRYPAIDVLASVSRTMPAVVSRAHLEDAARLRTLLGAYEAKRDLVMLGAYGRGGDATLDAALERMPAIERFLGQRADERSDFDDSVRTLASLR